MTWHAQTVVEKIGSFNALPEKSDEWSAKQPSAAAVKTATRLVGLISGTGLQPPMPFVFPTLDGGIQFEWRGSYRQLNLAVLPEGRTEYVLAERGQPLTEDELTSDADLRNVLAWLLEK